MTQISLRRIWEEVVRVMEDDDKESAGNRAAVVLLASLQVGTSVRALTRFTRIPRAQVAEFVDRAREQGIFSHNGQVRAQWFDENGGIALVADSMVLCGLMNRARNTEGNQHAL